MGFLFSSFLLKQQHSDHLDMAYMKQHLKESLSAVVSSSILRKLMGT